MNSFAKCVDAIQNSAAGRALDRFLQSNLLPVLMAAVMVGCYYLGQDMLAIWFLAACALAILTVCRDITPIFALFLFMNVIISMKNTPSKLGAESDYYTRPEVFIPIIVAISLAVLALIVRVVLSIATGKFKPTGMFFGMCAMAVIFLVNGLFSQQYTPLNAMFGFFLAAIFIGIYMLVNGNTTGDKRNFERIAFYFCTLFVVLATELAVAYLTYDGLFKNGMVDRAKLFFGWGMYNQMGMLLCMCIPAWFYLAAIKKFGCLYTIAGVMNIFAVYFTMSRQSMVGGAVIAAVCIIWLLICSRGTERLLNFLIVCIGLAVAAVLIYLNYETVILYIERTLDNIESGGNRIALWERAIEDFLSAPVLGVGFFHLKDLDAGFVGLDIIPLMYHNTPLQMLAACGIVGLAVYFVHRVQTVVCFAKNVNIHRVYLAITLGGLLLISLFDNHMFYIFPTIMYVGLLAFLQRTQKKEQ